MVDPKCIDSAEKLIRLWVHENKRVFEDRFINEIDHAWFIELMQANVKEYFNMNWDIVVPEPRLIFGDFMIAGADVRFYDEISNLTELKTSIETYLVEHNDNSKQPMPLVMFMDAIEHVCRVARVLRQPQGNALLLGVGGSGRQSMTRLATYISGYRLFQVEIAKGYGMNEWREDIKTCLLYAGVEDKPVTFLFSDAQVRGLVTSGVTLYRAYS